MTDQPSYVVMTDVVVLVELAQPANLAATEFVPANQTALVANVVMMDVDINLVEHVHPHKPVQTVYVQGLPPLIVPEELVDPTELEEVVVLAPLDKDAVLDNVSVTMIVMKETVEMQSNPTGPTLQLALRDLVVLAHPVSLVVPMEDVLPKPHVPFSLQSLTAPPDEQLHLPVQLSFLLLL